MGHLSIYFSKVRRRDYCLNEAKSLPHRVNNARGLPPVMLMDTYSHQGYKDDPLAGLSPSVRFQRKLAQMQSEALLQIDREALSQKPEDRNVVLAPTINACLSRLASLNVECSSMVGEWCSTVTTCQSS